MNAKKALEPSVDGFPEASAAWSNTHDYALDLVALAKSYRSEGRLQHALQIIDYALIAVPGSTIALAWKTIVLAELGEHEMLGVLANRDLIVESSVFSVLNRDCSHELRQLADLVSTKEILDGPVGKMPLHRAFKTKELLRPGFDLCIFLDLILGKIGQNYLFEMPDYSNIVGAAVSDIVDKSAWGVVLERGGSIGPHYHPGSNITGVIYLSDGCGGDQGGRLRLGKPMKDSGSVSRVMDFVIEPVFGSFVVFPSYFFHQVEKFYGSRRLSLAFDLKF